MYVLSMGVYILYCLFNEHSGAYNLHKVLTYRQRVIYFVILLKIIIFICIFKLDK